jgi:endonuclease G
MNERVAAAASQRIRDNRAEIVQSIKAAASGNPFAAEPDDERRKARLQAKAGLTPREANAIDQAIAAAPAEGGREDCEGLTQAALEGISYRAAPNPAAAEKVWGAPDFVSVSFLEKGARVSRAVGRVAFRNGQAQGSGFLIGNGLFLTNHHVIPTAEFAQHLALEFDYELDIVSKPKPVTRFAIDTRVFVTDSDAQDGLDFTIVAVGDRLDGQHLLDLFGWTGLSDSIDRHMLGEFANIVQHPDGRYKEVVLRENRLVGRFANALHYVADTEPGSSGSAVFNSEWRVIALHHWGSPWREVFGEDGTPVNVDVNEGIRISAIVKQLRNRLTDLNPFARDRIAKALDMGGAPESPGDNFQPDAATLGRAPNAPSVRLDENGRAVWTLPIELSVQVPLLGGAPARPTVEPGSAAAIVLNPPAESPSNKYRDRSGYKRQFLDGFDIPLPGLGDDLIGKAAANKSAEPGDDPNELKYHHFSVVMNRERRLAFFTACNVDGNSAKSVDRKTKTVTPLRPDSAGLESAESAADAEAEAWYTDRRIDPDDYTGEAFYEKQKIPGFPNPQSKGRIARMFQKGHLVRRLDPCWGTDDLALQAEEDTFHWTNCSPQVGFFNQGTAAPSTPGTGGGALWRAVENYVLRNAVADKQRVTSFTGPIFTDEDRSYRGIQVPGRFFKIAVWVEDGELRSLAMIADQRPVLKVWPEALFSEAPESVSLAEAFMDPDELDAVDDFLTTIARVEADTGLDFGDAVRDADVRAGESLQKVDAAKGLNLRKEPRKRSSQRSGKDARRSKR